MTLVGNPVVLITGASRGIGAACARKLAADGFSVALNSYPDPRMIAAARQLEAEINAAGGTAMVLSADVSSTVEVDGIFDRCEEVLGSINSLVLNAAARARGPWTALTEDQWDTISAVNLKGAFLCARRAFGKGGAGAIVTVGSVQADLGASGVLAYVTSKAGLEGFTRSLAREIGPQGVRVNCVVPGAIQTEDELESFPDQADIARTLMGLQALQRRGLAEDVANVVSFLLADASSFVTGQTLRVDGGWVMG